MTEEEEDAVINFVTAEIRDIVKLYAFGEPLITENGDMSLGVRAALGALQGTLASLLVTIHENVVGKRDLKAEADAVVKPIALCVSQILAGFGFAASQTIENADMGGYSAKIDVDPPEDRG